MMGHMTLDGWLQIAIYAALLILLTKPLGGYMTRVFNGERTWLSPVLRPLELGFYRICGVRDTEEQHWISYATAMLAFSLVAVFAGRLAKWRARFSAAFWTIRLPA